MYCYTYQKSVGSYAPLFGLYDLLYNNHVVALAVTFATLYLLPIPVPSPSFLLNYAWSGAQATPGAHALYLALLNIIFKM